MTFLLPGKSGLAANSCTACFLLADFTGMADRRPPRQTALRANDAFVAAASSDDEGGTCCKNERYGVTSGSIRARFCYTRMLCHCETGAPAENLSHAQLRPHVTRSTCVGQLCQVGKRGAGALDLAWTSEN